MKKHKIKIDPHHDLATLDFSTYTSYTKQNLDPDDLIKEIIEWNKSLGHELWRGSEANNQAIIDTALTRYKMILRDILSSNRTSLTRLSAQDLADMYYVEDLTRMIRQLAFIMTQMCYLDLDLNNRLLVGIHRIPLLVNTISEAIDLLEDEEYNDEELDRTTTMMASQNTIMSMMM